MANVYTAVNKRPKTTYLQTFVQFNDEIGKWTTPQPQYYKPHQTLWPLPPVKRFRPMPPADISDEEHLRAKVHEPRGLKTPEQSFPIGYRHFHRDPLTKKLLHFDAENPLPYTLNTEFREEYRDHPKILPHLTHRYNWRRFGLPDPRVPAIGPAPRIKSIPRPDLEDDPKWLRDCNTCP